MHLLLISNQNQNFTSITCIWCLMKSFILHININDMKLNLIENKTKVSKFCISNLKKNTHTHTQKKKVSFTLGKKPTLSMDWMWTLPEKKEIKNGKERERGYVQASSAFLDAKWMSLKRLPCVWRTSSMTDTTENDKASSGAMTWLNQHQLKNKNKNSNQILIPI